MRPSSPRSSRPMRAAPAPREKACARHEARGARRVKTRGARREVCAREAAARARRAARASPWRHSRRRAPGRAVEEPDARKRQRLAMARQRTQRRRGATSNCASRSPSGPVVVGETLGTGVPRGARVGTGASRIAEWGWEGIVGMGRCRGLGRAILAASALERARRCVTRRRATRQSRTSECAADQLDPGRRAIRVSRRLALGSARRLLGLAGLWPVDRVAHTLGRRPGVHQGSLSSVHVPSAVCAMEV